jgi:hypothetical protein
MFEEYLRALLLSAAKLQISLSLSLSLVASNTRYKSGELEVKIRMGGEGCGGLPMQFGSSDLKVIFI